MKSKTLFIIALINFIVQMLNIFFLVEAYPVASIIISVIVYMIGVFVAVAFAVAVAGAFAGEENQEVRE